MKTILTAALAAMALGGGAMAQDAAPAVQARVAPGPAGFDLDLRFDRDAAAWAFIDSEVVGDAGRGWRLDQWTVETPGVVLETVNGHDLLRTVGGGAVPRHVRIRMTPRFVDLQSSYDPVLTFSTGASAWYSEAFNVIPVATAAEVETLPGDLDPLSAETGYARVTWSDPSGPVLFGGRREVDPVSQGGSTYVLFGPAEVVATDQLTTVVDPGLPTWVADELSSYAPRVADYYAGRLGPGAADKPMVMMSWTGPTPGATSMAGSVLPHLIVMAFEGDGVVQPSTGVRNLARWFIGHESAHFWLGETVHYADARDSWITEGGADLMALRATEALDPGYSGRAKLQKAVDDCVALAGEPIETSAARGQFRAHYACGDVFALAAEAAQKRATGGDWFDFLGPLIEASRQDRILTRSEWLSALTAVSGDESLAADIETLLTNGSPDAASIIARLFDGAGVAWRADGGRLVLL